MTAEVVRLIDRASVACGDKGEIAQWLIDWAESMRDGEFGEIRSVIVVTENGDGRLGVISQSVNKMDLARLTGLLTIAAHRRMDGDAAMADMT